MFNMFVGLLEKYTKVLPMYFIVLTLNLYISPSAVPQDKNGSYISKETIRIIIKQGVMCEEIRDRLPHNPGVIFSSSLGSVACFTELESVPEKTIIYHKYYFRDKLSAKKKLTLNPPNQAAFSSIQLRETDKGPWRVEIVDTKDNIVYIIRFSVTD